MAANFIAGKKDCSVNKIVQVMRSASDFDSFHEKWSDITGEAKLPNLVQILKQEGLHGCAELLRYCFDKFEENAQLASKIKNLENRVNDLENELKVATNENAKLNDLLKKYEDEAAKDSGNSSTSVLKLKIEELQNDNKDKEKELDWFKKFYKRDENGNTQLHLAIKVRNEEEVKKLVQHGALLNEKNNDGDTPLMFAANGDEKTVGLRIIKYLIDNGADPFVTDKKNWTFLHMLVSPTLSPTQFHDITVYLISKTLTLIYNMAGGEDKGECVLFVAIIFIEIQKETLKLLLENGLDLNVVNKNGLNLLAFAIIWKRSIKLLKDLVELGVNWKILFEKDKNLIFIATTFCNIDALKYLVTLGLDVNAQDSDGNTPLHQVVTNGEGDVLETVQCLIQSGANIATKNKYRHTAVDNAEKRNDIEYKNNVLILLGKK